MITCDSASGALSIAEPGSIMATHVHGSASFKIYDETDLGQCEEISAEQLSIHRKSVYEDLELAIHDFRLLFLHPATNEAKEIHCTLVKDCIKSSSGNGYVYQALSYTWGESQERHIIFINGHPFSVTHNLFRALKHLRKAEETRTLWVDAICIDQNSLSEKTHQVGLMREIYRGASQVLVWFGESDVEISRTLDILEERRMFQLLTKDELDPLLQGLAKIFKQPWWSRIWVVQEVLVASKPPLLGCGHRWLSWDDLEVGMRNLKRQDIFGEGAGNRFENPLNFYDIGLMTAESPIYGYLNTRMNGKKTHSCPESTPFI